MRLASTPRIVAVAATLGVSIAMLVFAFRGWTVEDADAYWFAAMRLREGAALYPFSSDPSASDVYRYAPWFAAAWIPLTFMPQQLVYVGWSAVLVLASVWTTALLARRGSWWALLSVLFGSLLVWTAARGNVQPLIILTLLHGLGRRSGPVWVGVTASLKAVPILFVLVFVARRDWAAAIWACIVTTVLVAPMPMLGWTPPAPGLSLSLYTQVSPIAWMVIAGAALVIAAIAAARSSPATGILAGIAAVAALPRLLLYDATFVAPGSVPLRSTGSQAHNGRNPTGHARWGATRQQEESGP